MNPTVDEIKKFADELRTEALEAARNKFGKTHRRTDVEITTDGNGHILSKRKIPIVVPAREIELDARGRIVTKCPTKEQIGRLIAECEKRAKPDNEINFSDAPELTEEDFLAKLDSENVAKMQILATNTFV